MKKKRGLFSKIYSITILMMLFTTALAGMQVMASTDNQDDQESQENKVHWESNTKDEEIEIPEGVTGDGGVWESPTYTSADDETNSTSIEKKTMSAGEEYAAIAAALIGVLAISAAKNSSSQSAPTVSEGNGIWVPESDRDAVIKMINKAASKEYYIDANGFVKEVIGAVEDPSKSSTYSSVLDRLIAGNNKVVIGVGDGWVSSGENSLEANAFTGDNSGITIGDNGTSQVVVVSGEDIPNSSADITLAHELIHALRGEEGIKSINTIGGINQDEEAHTIELENNIREELGYEVRKDGDISDGGDGSYGKYSDASEEDWYNRIDEMQGSDTLSGNAYSKWYSIPAPGSNFSPAHPDAPHITVYDDIDDLRDALSNESGGDDDDDCDCDCDCDCQWGDNYDDSIWSKGGSVSVVNNVVTGTVGWRSFSVPKRNWNTFFRSNADTKKTSAGINTAVSNYKGLYSQMGNNTGMGVRNFYDNNNSIGKLYLMKAYDDEILMGTGYQLKDSYSLRWQKDRYGNWLCIDPTNGELKTGWIQDKSKWYYLNKSGIMQTGWEEVDGKWYYLDGSGAMLANTTVDGYNLDASGVWQENEGTSKDEKIDPSKIQLSSEGVAFIKDYEECTKPALTKYDATPGEGDWTIGWGHKIRAGENFDNGITEQQAEELYKKDEDRMINTTLRPLLEKYNIQLTQKQFDALVSFTYQNGENTWDENSKARDTIRNFVTKGDYSETSLKKAYDVYMGEKQAPGSIKRRTDEMEMFTNGDYTRMD